MFFLLVSVEEELQTFLKLIILSVTCLISNSICTYVDVKENFKVSIGINFSPKAKQVVVIQPLVSNVNAELSNEKVEIRGCRTTKAPKF